MDVDEFQKQMEEELAEWEKLGVAPGDYKPGEGFLGVYIRMELLQNMLVEAGIFEMEDLDGAFRELSLIRHKEIRENLIEPQVRKMRQEMIRQGLPRMDIPRGNHKGH